MSCRCASSPQGRVSFTQQQCLRRHLARLDHLGAQLHGIFGHRSCSRVLCSNRVTGSAHGWLSRQQDGECTDEEEWVWLVCNEKRECVFGFECKHPMVTLLGRCAQQRALEDVDRIGGCTLLPSCCSIPMKSDARERSRPAMACTLS